MMVLALALTALLAAGCGPAELTLTGLVEGPPGADLSGWMPVVMSLEGERACTGGFVEDYEAFQRQLRYGTREGDRYRVDFPAEWASGYLVFYADIDGDGRFTPGGTDILAWAHANQTDLAELARAGELPPVRLWPFTRLSVALDLPPGMPSAGFGPAASAEFGGSAGVAEVRIPVRVEGTRLVGAAGYTHAVEAAGPCWGRVTVTRPGYGDTLELWFSSADRPGHIAGALSAIGVSRPELSVRVAGLQGGAWIMLVGSGRALDGIVEGAARVDGDGLAQFPGLYGPASYWLYADRAGDGFSPEDRCGYYDGGALSPMEPERPVILTGDAELEVELAAEAPGDFGSFRELRGLLALPTDPAAPWDDPAWVFTYSFDLTSDGPGLFPFMNRVAFPLPGALEGPGERRFIAGVPTGAYGFTIQARLEMPGTPEEEWPRVWWYGPERIRDDDLGTLAADR